jgi:hypothetical protein
VDTDAVHFGATVTLTTKNDKLTCTQNNNTSEVRLTGGLFVKLSPPDSNYVVNITNNIDFTIPIQTHTRESKLDTMESSDSGILGDGKYSVHAGITFIPTHAGNVILSVVNKSNKTLTSIDGKLLKKNELTTLRVFGMGDITPDSPININIRSDSDMDIQIIDWSILLTRI